MQKLIIHTDFMQGSEEWHRLRLGKITATGCHKLLGTKDASEKYLYDRISEIVTKSKSDGEERVADVCRMHMDRGNNYESTARELYSLYKFIEVKEVGLVQLGGYLSCSPDGLIDDDGMIEIKVLDSNNYTMQIIEIKTHGYKKIEKKHYEQIQFSLYICKRKWCDYVLYNPKHAGAPNNGLSIYRIEADLKIQERIHNAVEDAIKTINEKVAKYYEITKSSILN